jgi:hypothetical protein
MSAAINHVRQYHVRSDEGSAMSHPAAGLDWTDYFLAPAPPSLLCQFRRRRANSIEQEGVRYAQDFPSEFNCAGLEWKLTGIAREELDRMPEEVRRQVMPEHSLGQFVGALVNPFNPLGLLFYVSGSTRLVVE